AARSGFLRLLVLGRRRGYNARAKRWLGAIRQFAGARRKAAPVRIERVDDPALVRDVPLEPWSYRRVYDLPPELRKALVDCALELKNRPLLVGVLNGRSSDGVSVLVVE